MQVGIPDVISDLIAGLIVAALSWLLIFLLRWAGPELLERWAHRVQPLAWPLLAAVSFVGSLLSAIIRGNPWPTVIVLGVLLVLGMLTVLLLQYGPTRFRNSQAFARSHAWQMITVVFFLSTVALYVVDIGQHKDIPPRERIVFVVDLDDTETMALRGILDQLEPKLDADIFLMNVDRSRYIARLDHMVAARDTKWDLIAVDINRLGLLVEKGLVGELAKSYDEIVPPALLPTLRPLLTYDGKFYFAPFRPNIKIAYYNESKFQQYGLDPPETWEELLAVAKRFKDEEGVGRVAIQGYPGAASAVTMIEFICAAGGDPFTLADQGSVDALAFLQKLEPYLAREYAETRFDTANELLIDEVVYLVDNWTFGIKVVVEDAGKEEIKAYSGWKGPKEECHTLGGDVMAVPKGAPHPDKAIELIELLISKKIQSALVKSLRWPPARFDAYENFPPQIEPYFDAVSEALVHAKRRPTAPQWLLMERCLDDAFEQLVKNAQELDSLDRHRKCLKEVPSLYVKYKVQPGDTLASVAQRVEAPEQMVALINQMSSRAGLLPGQILLVPAQLFVEE